MQYNRRMTSVTAIQRLRDSLNHKIDSVRNDENLREDMKEGIISNIRKSYEKQEKRIKELESFISQNEEGK